MSGLIERIQNRAVPETDDPRVIEIADGDADEVLDALGSETRRATFRLLFEEPRTPSEVADRLDTSIQNVDYHLTSLEETGLVEPVDTVYSEKGNEMTVYGPANDPLVFVGDDDRTTSIQRSLTEVVGGLGLLAVASLLVQWGAELLVRSRSATLGAAGPAGTTGPAFPDGSVGWVVFEVIEPGVLFFVACLVLAAVTALWTRQ
ncbi:ArsR/SmtB family transcription factor [Halorientalis litorea]|jgi:DNA-binding transcriptional ArsR family regulator|uniref:ArsR/SmtB family transcription factor n=1 Tax=Halorientalis litorea TaxID=2931977 RepID=UPI001FF60014|nr:helix-turn-helix domain-containing protein [Halorientalis litorea]